MKTKEPSCIYGPVQSWRLGKSLGVDVLCIDSICSFQCVYCQLGKINQVTSTRNIFVSIGKVLADLKKYDWQSVDAITFSGSGEPTLAQNLGQIIEKIKGLTNKPIVVLTNSTLLHLREVRKELALADKIYCKLDAWSEKSLNRFDRPHRDVSLESIITGIRHLRLEFDGFLALQTMILRSLNEFEIEELGEIYSLIKPDEIQLNLPTRPIPHEYFLETRGNEVKGNGDFKNLKTVTKKELLRIKKELTNLTKLPIITR